VPRDAVHDTYASHYHACSPSFIHIQEGIMYVAMLELFFLDVVSPYKPSLTGGGGGAEVMFGYCKLET
jgi:hypothetical protein